MVISSASHWDNGGMTSVLSRPALFGTNVVPCVAYERPSLVERPATGTRRAANFVSAEGPQVGDVERVVRVGAPPVSFWNLA